jgi:hypothetical protein
MSAPDVFGDPSAQLVWLAWASYWTNLLWPVVLTGAITIVKRKQLMRPRFFMIIGCLICFGVTFLVGQLRAFWVFPLAASTISEHLFATLAGSLLGVFVFSMLLSGLPLLYLYRICSVPMSTSNNRWRGPWSSVVSPRALGDSVRPRRLGGASARPLNFTVRRHRWAVPRWRAT